MHVTLLDNDECVEQSPCDGNAVCTNTPGSFTCACNEGYSGDGTTCTGQNFNAELDNLDLSVNFKLSQYTCKSTVIVKYLHACYSARY